ncbi:MAG: hypothetical protein GY754_30790 [bacterium]|nr:hypothetical protein [bacterium]
MGNDRDTERIIKEFLANASPEERAEVNHLLKERKQKNVSLEGLDFSRMAREMSEQINEQVGASTESIRETARMLVINLARQHKPDITPEELDALLRESLPTFHDNGAKKKLAPDMLLKMIKHFIAYSTGQMSEKEKRSMPQGWAQVYWDGFPVPVQRLIAAYLKNTISEADFRNGIREVLTDNR